MPYTRRQQEKQVFEKKKYVTRPGLSGVPLSNGVEIVMKYYLTSAN